MPAAACVITSAAKQSRFPPRRRILDCFVARATRNDGIESSAGRRNGDKLAPLVKDIEAAGGEILGPDALDNPDLLMPPSSVADAYWQLYQQPKSAWTFEMEIRPFGEKW